MPKLGFLTPSSFDKLMANGRKSDEIGKTAYSVVDQLVLDMLKVEREEVTAPSLEWGKENEWLAIKEYENQTMREVIIPEFRVAPDLEYVGGTADGLIGYKLGGIEIKNPFNPINHLKIEENYKNYTWQIIGYIWIYELQWNDFTSYDDRFSKKFKLRIKRIKREQKEIDMLKERCKWAYQEARKQVREFKKQFKGNDNG